MRPRNQRLLACAPHPTLLRSRLVACSKSDLSQHHAAERPLTYPSNDATDARSARRSFTRSCVEIHPRVASRSSRSQRRTGPRTTIQERQAYFCASSRISRSKGESESLVIDSVRNRSRSRSKSDSPLINRGSFCASGSGMPYSSSARSDGSRNRLSTRAAYIE